MVGMLVSMSSYAEIVPLDWGDLAMSELPTGTVTLLLADVEGSTRLWESQPEQMAAAVARLNTVVGEVVARHRGVRPLEQGEGDSFVVAFAKASDAIACALALQRTDLDPVKVRIGVHTGEIQLRDDANYAGPTINRTARLRDLAHGGQTVLSGATEAMVIDRLPTDAWLTDLGSHALRDLPRPERVLQLNHPDLRAAFPPLRVAAPHRRSRLPVQLTSFVGRVGQVATIAELLGNNRLVTLTGAGGAGKTRLALRVAAEVEPELDGNVFFVDLAPITNPDVVPVAVARAQLVDVLGLLVDKSLVVAEDSSSGMRYRLLETVRQYSLEKLAASGEADTVRARHCAYYAFAVTELRAEMLGAGTVPAKWVVTEMDNLRSAFAWTCENTDFATGLTMVTALYRFWLNNGRYREGHAAFGIVFHDERFRRNDVAPEIWIAAVTDEAILAAWFDSPPSLSRIEDARAAARDIGDDRLTARILLACSATFPGDAGKFLAEAVVLARACGDEAVLVEILSTVTYVLVLQAGLPEQAHAIGEEAWRLADRLGDRFWSRYTRSFLGVALIWVGRLSEATVLSQSVVDEARLDGDPAMEGFGLTDVGFAHAYTGDPGAAHTAASAALSIVSDVAGVQPFNHAVLAHAALAQGDPAQARRECEAALAAAYPSGRISNSSLMLSSIPMAQAAMACADLPTARKWADSTVARVVGAHQVAALTVRARVAIAQGELAQAERDAHAALAAAAETAGLLSVPDALECLAILTDDDPQRAARLVGAAQAVRQRTQEVRCRLFDHDHEQTLARIREALGDSTFEQFCSEGRALSTTEAIAFAQRGRGERKRPSSGWESLTPAELDVVRLVSEGLSNRDIAARLFISPRTAQTHLTHVYSKLNLSSRVQVAQEAARHIEPADNDR